MSGRSLELGRLDPVDGQTLICSVPDDCQTLWVENGLSAPLYGRWGETPQDPPPASAAAWDFAIPGSSLTVIPIPAGIETLRLTADYPGAVPVADFQAVVNGSPCTWAPFVGPIDS